MPKILEFYHSHGLILLRLTIACLLALTISGCMKEQASQLPPSAIAEDESEMPEEPDPRTLASLQLTEQGRGVLQGRAVVAEHRHRCGQGLEVLDPLIVDDTAATESDVNKHTHHTHAENRKTDTLTKPSPCTSC